MIKNNYLKTLLLSGSILFSCNNMMAQWATYYGGSATEDAYGVALDKAGNIYMTGYSSSATNIASTGSYQSAYSGGTNLDAYVAKFNSAGVRQWGTYFGGGAGDQSNAITCDKWGNVYIVGFTSSGSGVGTIGSHQQFVGGGTDAFLAKFDSGGHLKWATCYGGTGTDYGYGVVTDDSGNVYMSGVTNSATGISTPGSYKDTLHTGNSDAFFVKFDSAGVRKWATYFGAGGYDDSRGITLDANGNIYLAGNTGSTTGIATPTAFRPHYGGTPGNDAYLAKFSNTGKYLWGTYYGVADYDGGAGVSYGNGHVYLVGYLAPGSVGLATPGSYQTTPNGSDAFLAQFDTTGNIEWATYYGGNNVDMGTAVVADGVGNVYLLGQTKSNVGIGWGGKYKDTLSGATNWNDAFLVKFDDKGARQWATYFGGTNDDVGKGLAVDITNGGVYFCGTTKSNTGVAIPGSWQDAQTGINNQDAFLTRLFECPTMQKPRSVTGADTLCPNGSEVYAVTPVTGATAYIWTLPNGWTGSSDSLSITALVGTSGGYITVRAKNFCDTSLTDSLSIYVPAVPPATITVNGFVLGTAGSYASYQWIKDGNIISGATNATYPVTQNGKYSVAVVTAEGCKDTASYTITNVGIDDVAALKQSVRLYPNPTTGIVHIEYSGKLQAVQVSVFNSLGQSVLYNMHNNATTIDLSQQPKGIYFIRAASGNAVYTSKILLQ